MSLVAWYPLNGNLEDKTGFSGDLSIEGTVDLTIDGKIGGKAPNFIGVASNGLYINNFIQDVENWQSNFSYACWVYINSQEGNWQYLISTGRDCGSYGCNLQIRSSDLVICYETKNQQHYSTGISVPLQVWTHITMTCDDNFIYFYVNGEYKTKVENKGFGYTEAKNQALYIGKMSYNNTVNYFPLNGSIQDVRIYNHCLSDAEVKKISKGLVLHYIMDSVYEENKVYDSSGFGNDGEIIGEIIYSNQSIINSGSMIFNKEKRTNITLPTNTEVTDEITVSIWGYKKDWNSQGERMFGTGTQLSGWAIGSFSDEDKIFQFYLNGSWNQAGKQSILNSGWHLFNITFDGYNLKYYIDGNLIIEPIIFETKQNITYNNKNIFIGNHINREMYFNGLLSDARIYATALSEKDILKLYQEREKVDNKGNLYCSELNEVERRVEYLESNGTQYIDTEIKADDTTEVEIIVAATNTGATWDGCLFGSRTSTNSSDSYILWFNHYSNASTPQLSLVYNGVNYGKTVFITNNPNGKHIITFRNKDLYIDNELKTTATSVQPNSTLPLLFLALNTSSGVDSRKFRGKIYSCKIWQNNTLVRDFLPVISTEEGHIGEACLFDTVTNTYFYNQGTGKFTTNLDESTSHIDFTSKGIVNTDYIIEGKDKTKIKNDGNIIEVNNLYEN